MALPNVDANKGQMIYNNPHWAVVGGSAVQTDKSSVGEQVRLDYLMKNAMMDAAKDEYFAQLSSTIGMPKHMGTKIKREFFIPLIDDRNTSSQGINPDGTVDATTGSGNFYGSSKNIGVITGKLPTLTEVGGRVNRVGFTRIILEGSIREYGFFYEFTEAALNFDTNSELLMHMGRESIRGASRINEAIVQAELLNGAGTVMYGGTATSKNNMTAEAAGSESIVSYRALQRLSIILDDNDTPKQTTAIYGSRMIDTRVIGSGRVMYIGSALENQLRNMVDAFNNPAFIPTEKYGAAASSKILRGEIGTVAQFRIVVVPQMHQWSACGVEDVGADSKYRTSAGYVGNTNNTANVDPAKQFYDVFPMLVVGDDSFTHIGFETGRGAGAKFKIITKLPSAETATSSHDPFGKTGFTSIQWWHGMLIQRPERLALYCTLAEV